MPKVCGISSNFRFATELSSTLMMIRLAIELPPCVTTMHDHEVYTSADSHRKLQMA